MIAAWILAALGIAGATPDTQRAAFLTKPARNVYGSLFQPADLRAPAQTKAAIQAAERLQQLAKPRVVCGLRMKQVDPAIDSRMSVTLPRDGVDFKIRRVEPTVCRE